MAKLVTISKIRDMDFESQVKMVGDKIEYITITDTRKYPVKVFIELKKVSEVAKLMDFMNYVLGSLQGDNDPNEEAKMDLKTFLEKLD